MYKISFATLFVIAVLVATPHVTRAQVTTTDMSNTALLQSLLAQIQVLEAKLLQMVSLPIGAQPSTPPTPTSPIASTPGPTNSSSATGPSTPACFSVGRNLSFGMTGNDVVRLQQLLSRDASTFKGYTSGTFDTATEEALIAFQLKNGVITDRADGGILGPKTQALLKKGCSTVSTAGGGALTITNFTGPVALNIQSLGTWSVSAVDSRGKPVVFSVSWGDEGTPPTPVFAASNLFSHAYGVPGTYTVTVTAKDQDGLTTKASMQISVNAPPAVSFVSYPATGTPPLLVQFSANSLPDGNFYSVDFGDGTPPAFTQMLHSTSTNASLARYTLSTSHVYQNAGSYTASLRSASTTIIGTVRTTVSTSTAAH